MEISIITIIATLTNIALLVTIATVIFKAIKGIKNFINRNKDLDKKVDIILNKLNEKDNK
jgi:hypothetical protein